MKRKKERGMIMQYKKRRGKRTDCVEEEEKGMIVWRKRKEE